MSAAEAAEAALRVRVTWRDQMLAAPKQTSWDRGFCLTHRRLLRQQLVLKGSVTVAAVLTVAVTAVVAIAVLLIQRRAQGSAVLSRQ
jgi:hypothetical protein